MSFPFLQTSFRSISNGRLEAESSRNRSIDVPDINGLLLLYLCLLFDAVLIMPEMYLMLANKRTFTFEKEVVQKELRSGN
jgi:hypothetical protein